jgi:hypothetical protein
MQFRIFGTLEVLENVVFKTHDTKLVFNWLSSTGVNSLDHVLKTETLPNVLTIEETNRYKRKYRAKQNHESGDQHCLQTVQFDSASGHEESLKITPSSQRHKG